MPAYPMLTFDSCVSKTVTSLDPVIAAYAVGLSTLPAGNRIDIQLTGYVTNPIETDAVFRLIIGSTVDDDTGTQVLEYTYARGSGAGSFSSDRARFDPTEVITETSMFLKLCGYYYGDSHPSLRNHTITLFGINEEPIVYPRFSDIEVMTNNVIMLYFDQQMANDATLNSVGSYTISSVGNGNPSIIQSVITGTEDSTDRVVLILQPPSKGEEYEITVSASVKNTEGNAIDTSHRVKQFMCRSTKMDLLLHRMPPTYSMAYTSVIRNLLQAISLSDDKIGGNRGDYL